MFDDSDLQNTFVKPHCPKSPCFSESSAVLQSMFCLLEIKTLYKLPFHPGGGGLFMQDKQ